MKNFLLVVCIVYILLFGLVLPEVEVAKKAKISKIVSKIKDIKQTKGCKKS